MIDLTWHVLVPIALVFAAAYQVNESTEDAAVGDPDWVRHSLMATLLFALAFAFVFIR